MSQKRINVPCSSLAKPLVSTYCRIALPLRITCNGNHLQWGNRTWQCTRTDLTGAVLQGLRFNFSSAKLCAPRRPALNPISRPCLPLPISVYQRKLAFLCAGLFAFSALFRGKNASPNFMFFVSFVVPFSVVLCRKVVHFWQNFKPPFL
jgi:hypothetical protein